MSPPTETKTKKIQRQQICSNIRIKYVFSLQPHRSKTYRIYALFHEYSGRTTTNIDTKEYATFRHDTIKMKNGLYCIQEKTDNLLGGGGGRSN